MKTLNRTLYSLYRSAYPASQWRGDRITMAGRVVIGAIIAAGALGLDIKRAATYQMFTLLGSAALIDFLYSRVFKVRLAITRRLPTLATAGEKITYPITVQNLTSKKLGHLIIQEKPQAGYPDYEEFLSAREPEEADRNRWDQAVKYYRFQWLVEQHTRARPKEQPLPGIGANSYLKTYIELEPKRRGYLNLSGFCIKRRGPFGFFKSVRYLPLPERLLILPKRFAIPSIQLPGQHRLHAGGVTLASSVGNAQEFRALREYRPGDPMRMLHWKSVAKTSELIIRENEDEYFVRHALILDTFMDQPYSNIFEMAVSIAASLACTIKTQESMLDLIFVEDKAYCFSAGRGVDHTNKMLEILACVAPCSDKPFSTLFPLVKEHASILSGCICILHAWDDTRKELVQLLKERNVPVKVIVVTDQKFPAEEGVHFIHPDHPEEELARL